MKHKLSPWFNVNETPAHCGVYKTRLCIDNVKIFAGWSCWIGFWSDTRDTKAQAASCRIRGAQNKQWQGIVKGKNNA